MPIVNNKQKLITCPKQPILRSIRQLRGTFSGGSSPQSFPQHSMEDKSNQTLPANFDFCFVDFSDENTRQLASPPSAERDLKQPIHPDVQQLRRFFQTTTPSPWSSDSPFDLSNDSFDSGLQQRGRHYSFPNHTTDFQLISTPSPAALLTPTSDSQLLTGAPPSPFVYHAPQQKQSHSANFQRRSMSLNAIPDPDVAQQVSSQNGTFLPTPKQIRFVSTDGQPHTKRRRINAACLTCRKRKTRCSGERPECKTCTDNGHVCAGYADKAPLQENKVHADIAEEDDDESDDSSLKHKQTLQKQMLLMNAPRETETPLLRKDDSLESNHTAKSGMRDEPDFRSPESNLTANSASQLLRHRVPFFRYFGPTAIVPGFKQMVVQLKDRDHRRSALSLSGESPASGQLADGTGAREPSPQEIAFYDATDPAPNAPLITHLCETFFTHLGCNYPFLQRDRFMKDLEEKRVDAILVDAVCAIAARFSSNPSLTRPSDQSTPLEEDGKVKRAFKGQPYAQRAASCLVDTFGCPTIAVAQACLLLAYEEFGTDRDSGLWMYLGTSIRMAQDLGIQKLEGMQLEGRMGPTPKTAKTAGAEGKREERKREAQQERLTRALMEKAAEGENIADRRASEQERIETFWAIFFLDRAVSSGVGRPVTLRDKDIEISFPYRPDESMVNGYPHPFPVMIRIVHLYGRIADVINNIQGHNVTPDGLKRLTALEKDLTGIYQKMSSRLHFNATNFQHYVKAEQGTNFILLHFWFHTSIILLHQPTLLHSLESHIQQLFPDSRELSMSSAKTIADILAFAELIDVKSFIGNPFTSQPMYVAACAFLAEVRAHASQPNSRQTSPSGKTTDADVKPNVTELNGPKPQLDSKMAAKHSLLATAANQNYQRCYKALKMLDHYWAGCRYILTALDQKSKGLMDPILFTREDLDGEMPSIEPSFTQPGWRRTSHGLSPAARRTSIAWSPKVDWSQAAGAIGWSLTGTTNSPAPNLSFLFQNPTPDNEKHNQSGTQARQQGSSAFRVQQGLYPQQQQSPGQDEAATQPQGSTAEDPSTFNAQQSTMMPPPNRRLSALPYDPVSAADADLLLGLHSPYSVSPSQGQLPQAQPGTSTASFDYGAATHPPPGTLQHQTSSPYFNVNTAIAHQPGFTDMLIESQDIDMSNQFPGGSNFDNLSFPGGDMIWLEYLPQDVLNYFSQTGDSSQNANVNVQADMMGMPGGSGPPAGSQ